MVHNVYLYAQVEGQFREENDPATLAAVIVAVIATRVRRPSPCRLRQVYADGVAAAGRRGAARRCGVIAPRVYSILL